MTTTGQASRAARYRRKQSELVAVKVVSLAVAKYFARVGKGGRQVGSIPRQRNRQSVADVYHCLGPIYFRRAYRMEYSSFLHLHSILKEGILAAMDGMSPYRRNGGRQGGKYKLPPIPNGRVSTQVRLACAIRYSSGGSPYDIMALYGVSHSLVFDSLWQVVEALNKCQQFQISYPSCHRKQEAIALGFKAVSAVPFDNCAGAIDGVVIWTNKPTANDTFVANLDDGKFYCGRKKKYGLNCQVVSDANGRILDISITHGAATSDVLAFEHSTLFGRLEDGLLKDGLTLFGDNAYLNTGYMASPYPNASGTKDAYNFYQSQVRIRVECCFGMFVMKWGILRMAMPQNISMVKVIALVNALAKLHNYCRDESSIGWDEEIEFFSDENRLRRDIVYMQATGCVPLENSTEHGLPIPTQLTDIGNNEEDLPRSVARRQPIGRSARQRQEMDEHGVYLPRRVMHNLVVECGLRRPASNVRQST